MRRFVYLIAACLIAAQGPLSSGAAEPNSGVEFRTVEIYLDPKGKPLAAYQLDWTITSHDAKIVGIEGGEDAAFQEPPYYDPQAIQHERVVVAAFKVASERNLPKHRTRVATIHLQTKAGASCRYKFEKAEAATSNGGRISIEASIQERNGP